MHRICVLFTIGFVLITALNVFGQNDQNPLGDAEFDESGIDLQFDISKQPGGVVIQYTLRNRSDRSIFVVTDPTRMNGEKGPYLKMNDDKTEVSVIFGVFPDPDFYSYTDQTSVQLKKIVRNETLSGAISLIFPLRETFPPFGGGPGKAKRSIVREEIRNVQLSMGYFTEETVRHGRLDVRLRGRSVFTGDDGETSQLYELQRRISKSMQIPDL